MMQENKYCVYVHCRKDNNKVFYVGKGSIKRANAKSPSCRNSYWVRTARKYGFYVVILYRNLTNDQACKLEREIIADFGRENLCNLTDGGDGAPGRVVTDEVKKIMSDKFKGVAPSKQTIKASIAANSKPIGTNCGLRFNSATDAARWLQSIGHKNANKSGIFTALEGRSNKAYGYEFRYLDENGELVDNGYIDKTKTRNKSVTNGLDVFESVTAAGEFVIKNKLSTAKSINTINANIVSCCKGRGRLKTVYGFSWGYVNV